MKRSIRRDLLAWLIGPLATINLVGAGMTFWLAWTPALAAWDQSLADAAWALVPRLHASGDGIRVDLPQQAEQVLRVDHFDSIYFTVRDASGRTLVGDVDFPALQTPARNDDPVFDDAFMRGEPIRVSALKTMIGSQSVLIGVAETLLKRTQSRWRILLTLLLMEAILIAVSLSAVWMAVKNGLLPLKKMQEKLANRPAFDLSPVANVNVPNELGPLLAALNDLLARAQAGTAAKQVFLANVAHQLRTPLAGAKLQLEWLQERYAGDGEAAQATDMILASNERMTRQTNQLLSLARAEPSEFSPTCLKTVSLDELVSRSVQHFVQQADLRGIDLGFDLEPTVVNGDRFLLRDLIDNLVDNAVRYSPAHGVVTVRCWQEPSGAMLVVEDNGPGIAKHDREAVFDRFYRVDDATAGSGLGLAIVRDIVLDHGARIEIRQGNGGVGTEFVVQFPAPG